MKKILHLSHTDIVHDSRILKEMKAAENSGYQVSGIGIKLKEGTRESKFVLKLRRTLVSLYSLPGMHVRAGLGI